MADQRASEMGAQRGGCRVLRAVDRRQLLRDLLCFLQRGRVRICERFSDEYWRHRHADTVVCQSDIHAADLYARHPVDEFGYRVPLVRGWSAGRGQVTV